MADTSQARPVNQRVIRDRLSLWEAKTNPTAPLTAKQKDALIELTSIAAERPIPPEVRIVVAVLFLVRHPPPLTLRPCALLQPTLSVMQRVCCAHLTWVRLSAVGRVKKDSIHI